MTTGKGHRSLCTAVLAVCLCACSGPALEDPGSRAEVAAAGSSASYGASAASPSDTALLQRLHALEERYGAAEVERMLESLPTLDRYFDEQEVSTGTIAALRHWARLSPHDQVDFAQCLGSIMVDGAWIEARTSGLPNGYHDVAYALPESKALYMPVLERYGLDPATATSYEVASSLSTFDDVSLRYAIAERLCRISDGERRDYVARFEQASEAAGSAGGAGEPQR